MTVRESEKKVYSSLDEFKSFCFDAGPGSGKTYTLEKAIEHIISKNSNLSVQNQKILSSSREATLAYRPPREVEAFVLCPLPRHRRVQACTPQPRRGHKKARAKLEKRKISPFLHTRHNRERR